MEKTSASSSSSSNGIIHRFVLVLLAFSLCSAMVEASYEEEIPEEIEVPSGNTFYLGVDAVGHQHYSFNGSSWVLFNATANLYPLNKNNNNKTIVGYHFFLPQRDSRGGQPTWKSNLDNSSVTARPIATSTPNPDAIAWILLQATTTTSNSESKDSCFGSVTYVQRVNTEGGLQPSYLGTNVGDIYLSPYTTIYLFYVEEE